MKRILLVSGLLAAMAVCWLMAQPGGDPLIQGLREVEAPQIRKLQFPVFSRGVVPSTTINHYRFAGVNVTVTCAGVKVNGGDFIVADEDGVAVVPKAHAADVLKKAQDLDNTEHSMIPFIEKFRSIKEAVAKFGRI